MVQRGCMHDFPLLYSPLLTQFAAIFIPIILIAALWVASIKGYALWHAARGGQKSWFIALLFINTFGILEIVYLVWFRPKAPSAEEAAPILTSSHVQE